MQNFNQNTTFLTPKGSKNYKEFLQDVWCFSNNIKEKHFGIFCEDTYLFMVAFFGGILSNAKVFILPSNLSFLQHKVLYDECISGILQNKCEDIDYSKMVLDVNAEFYIQTSGSSGEQKSIAKSVDQMIKEAEFLHNHFEIKEQSLFFSSVLHQHLFGLTFKVFTALVSGAKIHYANLNYPEVMREFLDSYKDEIFILVSSPLFLESLAKQENMESFKKIKRILTAGSKLDNEVRKALNAKIPAEVVEIYGSTETGVIAKNISNTFVRFPCVKVSNDAESRLIVSSPWQNCEGGFLCNDCVEINGDFIKILGRYDRIVKLHDRRVSLDAVENAIKQSPLIKGVVVAEDSELKRLCAILVLSDDGKKHFRKYGKKGIVEQINSLVKVEFGTKLRYFYIRSTIPYNQQGKLPKKDVLQSIKSKITPTFKVESKLKDSVILKAYVDEGCFYFNGHFYNFPLVPGFVELGFVFNALLEHFNIQKEMIKHIQSVKFTSFLRPCDEVKLEIKLSENRAHFSMFANDKECANGRLLF